MNLKGYRYYSFGVQKQDSLNPLHYREWCFRLEKIADKQPEIDSLSKVITKIQESIQTDIYRIKILDSIASIEPNQKEEIDSLRQKIYLDSLSYSINLKNYNTLDSIQKRESLLDSLICFNEINRSYQKPLKFSNYMGLNLNNSVNLSSLNEGKFKPNRKRWEKINELRLLINQNAFSYWNAGGENSISSILRGSFERNYRYEFIIWKNRVNFGLGFNQESEQSIKKTEDLFEINSTFGYRTNLNSNWYYSANTQLRSQFANGYNYPDVENPISKFMAPAYFMIGAGAAYASKDEKTAIYLSPLTDKTTIVRDQRLADAGAFGVDPAEYDEDGNLVKPGKQSRVEIGFLFQGKSELTIVENVTMTNELRLYTDYVNNFLT